MNVAINQQAVEPIRPRSYLSQHSLKTLGSSEADDDENVPDLSDEEHEDEEVWVRDTSSASIPFNKAQHTQQVEVANLDEELDDFVFDALQPETKNGETTNRQIDAFLCQDRAQNLETFLLVSFILPIIYNF
jgi:hypothetical protein